MSTEPYEDAVSSPPVLVVVARPEAGLRASASGLTATAADARSLAAVLDEAGAPLRQLFGTTEERLLHERSLLPEPTDEMAEAAPPDLSVYYRVDAPAADLASIATRLREHEAVQGAYVKPPTTLPAQLNTMTARLEGPPAVTPNFEQKQGYLGRAPGGIEARFAWRRPGGRGSGVGIIDIEEAWQFTHEDLLHNLGGALASPPDHIKEARRHHGTAVLGEFSADHNGRGVSGICPEAIASAVPIWDLQPAGAIRVAANKLKRGDIILIECQREGPGRSVFDEPYIPIEWWPDDFDAVRYAVRRGILVVHTAANGYQNLDDAVYDTPAEGFPPDWVNPFRRGARDSGAIVVGAGAPPPGPDGGFPDRSRLEFSDYGAMVDAQGWGFDVTTTGYGDLQGGSDENAYYTESFSGTSSAAPIVVGALGCLQGIVRAIGRPARTPAEARLLLRTTGSPQQKRVDAPVKQRIGSRPNLRQLVAEVTSRPGAAVASWGPDRLDVFVVGGDRAVYQKAWDADVWHPSDKWTRLGGIIEAPAVVTPEEGRLDVFAIGATNRCVYHKAGVANAWRPSTEGWERLGDAPMEGAPAAVSWGRGRLDVFVAGPDRALYHKWWDGSAWRPSEGGRWERLGGAIIGTPLAVSWGPRRLDLFAIGPDRAVYHRPFDGSWSPTWRRLGGAMEGGLTAVCWEPGRIDLLAVGDDRAVYHKAWDDEAWQSPAGGWTRLGGTVEGAPAAVSWGPNRLDVFVVGMDRNLYHKWWDGAAWRPSQTGDWERMGGDVLASPAIASQGPRQLDVVAVATDRTVYHKAFDGTAWRPSLLQYNELGGMVRY
jgi:Subtilase family/Repeat of unknown function (DUF346)